MEAEGTAAVGRLLGELSPFEAAGPDWIIAHTGPQLGKAYCPLIRRQIAHLLRAYCSRNVPESRPRIRRLRIDLIHASFVVWGAGFQRDFHRQSTLRTPVRLASALFAISSRTGSGTGISPTARLPLNYSLSTGKRSPFCLGRFQIR